MSTLTLERSRIIDAPVADVWAIVSDLDGYHRHAATLADTTVLSGTGMGARRQCIDTDGNIWKETCTLWVPEQRYTVDVDVTTYPAKYRVLFRRFTGTWSVAPEGGGTLVTIRFEAELRRFPGLPTLARLLARRSESDIDAILDSYNKTTIRSGVRDQ